MTYSSVASVILMSVTSREDLSRMYCTIESMIACEVVIIDVVFISNGGKVAV